MRCAFNVRFGSLSAIRLFYFSNMAAPVYWPSSVVAIKMNKCDHLETKNFMVSVRNTKLIEEVFNDHHPGAEGDEFEITYTLKSQCKTELNWRTHLRWKTILQLENKGNWLKHVSYREHFHNWQDQFSWIWNLICDAEGWLVSRPWCYKKKKKVKKKKSKIDLPTLFFSSLEPETQLFFFFGLSSEGTFWIDYLQSIHSIHTPKLPWDCCPCDFNWPIKSNSAFVRNSGNSYL